MKYRNLTEKERRMIIKSYYCDLGYEYKSKNHNIESAIVVYGSLLICVIVLVGKML